MDQKPLNKNRWNLEKLFDDENKITRVSSEDRLDDEVFKKAIEKWGKEEQFWMVVEEVGELLSAMNKVRRDRMDIHSFMDEVVDVTIMAKQMRTIDPALFDMLYSYKVGRLRRRLGMEK